MLIAQGKSVSEAWNTAIKKEILGMDSDSKRA
jgi:hypothetical protein